MILAGGFQGTGQIGSKIQPDDCEDQSLRLSDLICREPVFGCVWAFSSKHLVCPKIWAWQFYSKHMLLNRPELVIPMDNYPLHFQSQSTLHTL